MIAHGTPSLRARSSWQKLFLTMMPAIERQPVLRADPADLGLDLVRFDQIGRFSAQTEHDRPVGAVPAACERQRTIKVDHELRGLLELSGGRELVREAPRRSHRPYGVRARRPEPDLEQIESAYEHARC